MRTVILTCLFSIVGCGVAMAYGPSTGVGNMSTARPISSVPLKDQPNTITLGYRLTTDGTCVRSGDGKTVACPPILAKRSPR